MSSENLSWQNELSGQHPARELSQYYQNTYPTTEQRSGYDQIHVLRQLSTQLLSNFLNENTTQLQDFSDQSYTSNNQTSVITSKNRGQNDRYSIQSGQSQETNFNTMNHHAAFNQNLIGNSNDYNNTNSKEISFNGDKTSAEPDSTSGYDESDTQLQEANDYSDSESDSESSTEPPIYRWQFNYELFIKHVRKHECIWDRGNEEYNCKESRKRAWWNILERMDLEGEVYWHKGNIEKYHDHDDILEQEWEFIENNFKECKINRKQSHLKEPPKCEFYKELEFLDGVTKNENDDVIKYPDIPDIRAIFNTDSRLHYLGLVMIGKVLNGNNSCSCRNRNDVENGNKKTNDNKDSDSESSTKESVHLINRTWFNYRLFIKHVRKEECIWNRGDENYSNIRLREMAWLEVLSRMDDDSDDVDDDDGDDMNYKYLLVGTGYLTKYHMHVDLLEQEWKSIENNFKECKMNRKQSHLKEPPKCEFYKELEFLDGVMKNENVNVMTYPDVSDIRVICNLQIEYDRLGIFLIEYYFTMNNFRCSCSHWKNSSNRRNDNAGTSHKETLRSPFNKNIDNFNTYSNKENSERKSKEEKVMSGKVIHAKTSSFGAKNMSILSEQTCHPENESSQVLERSAKETDQSTDMIELYLSLIKEVKERPCIWNTQDCDYKNRKKTKEAWGEIKSIVKPPEDVTLKSKWKTIREDFKRCQKRRNEKKVSNCRYYEDLTFLTDVVTEMPPLTTKKESAYRKQSKTSTPLASTSTSASSDVIPPSPGIDFTRTPSNGILTIDISDEDVFDDESIHHQNGKNDNKKTDNSMNEIETSSPWTKERMRQRGKQRMLKTGRTPKYEHRPETTSEYSERVDVDISDDNNLSTEYPVLSKTINGAAFGESSNANSATTLTLNTRHSTSPRCNLPTLVDSSERINESPQKSNNNIDHRMESSHPKRKRKQNDEPHSIHRNSDIEFVEEGENFLAKALVKSLGSNEHKLLFFKQIDGKMETFSKKQKVVAEMLIQKALTKVEFMSDEQLNKTLNN